MLYTKDEALLEMLIIERKICYLTNINIQNIHNTFIYLSYKHYCEVPYKNCILDKNCKIFSISCIKKVYEFCAKKEVSRQFISDLINLRLKDLCKKYNLDIYNPIKQIKQSILILNEKRNIKHLGYEYRSKYCVFHRGEYVDFSECTKIKELDEDIDYLFKKENSSLKHTDKDDYVLKIDNIVKNTGPTRIIMNKTATDRQLEIARKIYPNAEVVRDDSNEDK